LALDRTGKGAFSWREFAFEKSIDDAAQLTETSQRLNLDVEGE
jgi:hypothetical protein